MSFFSMGKFYIVYMTGNNFYQNFFIGSITDQEKDVSIFKDKTGEPAVQQRDSSRIKKGHIFSLISNQSTYYIAFLKSIFKQLFNHLVSLSDKEIPPWEEGHSFSYIMVVYKAIRKSALNVPAICRFSMVQACLR